MGMKHALGLAGGAGGVDEVGGIVGHAVGIAGGRCLAEPCQILGSEEPDPVDGRQFEPAIPGDDAGAAVLEEARNLACREHRRGRYGYGSNRRGGKEYNGIVETVAHADEEALTGFKPRRLQSTGQAQHGFLDLGIGPLRGGLAGDDESGLPARLARTGSGGQG